MMDSMVAAILDGRKTVTRRIGPTWARVQPGDRLWVREAHCLLDACCWPDLPHRRVDVLVDPADEDGPTRPVWAFYRLDLDEDRPVVYCPQGHPHWLRWRPSRHMHRWASRIDLEVVSVRGEWGHSGRVWPDSRGSLSRAPDPVDDAEAAREGFGSADEFHEVWARMHPDHVGPVYRVEFRRAS